MIASAGQRSPRQHHGKLRAQAEPVVFRQMCSCVECAWSVRGRVTFRAVANCAAGTKVPCVSGLEYSVIVLDASARASNHPVLRNVRC
jgi:hypothetical protein